MAIADLASITAFSSIQDCNKSTFLPEQKCLDPELVTNSPPRKSPGSSGMCCSLPTASARPLTSCTFSTYEALVLSRLSRSVLILSNRSCIPISPSFRHTQLSCVSSACERENTNDNLANLSYHIAFKLTDSEVTDFYARQKANLVPGVPKFDPKRSVDGQRKLTVLKPLPPTSAGKQFELRNKVIGVYDKGKAGSVMETEQTIVDKATGEIYTKIVSSGFFVGQGNWGGPKGRFLASFYRSNCRL